MKMEEDSIFCKTNKDKYCFLRENFPDKQIDALIREGYSDKPVKCEYSVVLDASDGCDKDCIRKQIISKYLDDYFLEQIRCQEDLKWVKETQGKIDLGDIARRYWNYELLSSVFPVVYRKYKIYNKELHHKQLFEECSDLAREVKKRLDVEMEDFDVTKCSLQEGCDYYKRAEEMAAALALAL
jgi:hypothetical protein